jgi:hypothetical protein
MPKEASYKSWGISKTLCNQMHFTTPRERERDWNQMHKRSFSIFHWQMMLSISEFMR